MDTQITSTDVIAQFGAYYKNSGQNMQSLLMRPFFPFGTRDAFTNIPTDQTRVDFSDVQIGKILQPFQKAFTPKGTVTFKPISVNLRPVKIDEQFNVDELVYSWLGFLTNLNNDTDRKNWPFVRWFIDQYLMNQVMEDLELDAIYKGVYAAPGAGVAGNPADTIDGAKKLINAAIGGANPPTLINTGAPAVDPRDWCTQVEEFVKQVPLRMRKRQMTLNMNDDLFISYKEGRALKYNMQYAQETDLTTIRNFPNITVASRDSMSGSNKIWMTPIQNAVFLTKGFKNASGFQLESVDRNVKIWSDFHIGLGFLLMDLVYTNDQDLV
jgi:hypothetical protein